VNLKFAPLVTGHWWVSFFSCYSGSSGRVFYFRGHGINPVVFEIDRKGDTIHREISVFHLCPDLERTYLIAGPLAIGHKTRFRKQHI